MDHKKPDLRDNLKDKTAVTDNDAVLAGHAEKPDSVRMPSSDMHELTPGTSGKLAEGQTTKSS